MEPESGWSEADSSAFLDIGDVAVPSRREQIEMLLSLVPATTEEAFTAVELACGQGLLSEALLQRFPKCRVLALDGSQTMLKQARQRLKRFGERAEVKPFHLDQGNWLEGLPTAIRCVLASLALHHIHGEAKRSLFRDLWAKLEPHGALLIADVVEPASDLVRSSFAHAYDEVTRHQSLSLTGSLQAFNKLREDGWNYYALGKPPPGETPSRLFEQLKWLEEAGFSVVDCFWMRAGHAIYGGYR